MQTALEEAKGALEQEENKVLRAALELSQVRQEIDSRVAKKEEEVASTRSALTLTQSNSVLDLCFSLGRTMLVPWTHLVPLLRQSRGPRLML